MFSEKNLINNAKKCDRTIVFPEAGFSDRIVNACIYIAKKKIANVILIGDETALVLRYKNLKNITIINPKTSALTADLAQALYEKRKNKGLTEKQAEELIMDPFYFSTMLVEEGYADGMVGGAEVSTARNLKPALQIIKAKPGFDIVSSCFLFLGKNKVTKGKQFVVGDCALNEFPTSENLVTIAKQCVNFAETIAEITPRVAFLSYSTKGSANSDKIDIVKNASEQFKKKEPIICSEGEVQFDAAMIPNVAKVKIPKSKFVEKSANVLIMPDINAGNICYKAMQYFGGLSAIGPITIGLKKPVNDLSRGCTIKDIIVVTAITVLQSVNKKEKK